MNQSSDHSDCEHNVDFPTLKSALEIIFNPVVDVISTPATDQSCDWLKLSGGQIEDVPPKFRFTLSDKNAREIHNYCKLKINFCLPLLSLEKQMTGFNVLIQPCIEATMTSIQMIPDIHSRRTNRR